MKALLLIALVLCVAASVSAMTQEEARMMDHVLRNALFANPANCSRKANCTLLPSTNCQSADPRIVKLSQTVTQNVTSSMKAASLIFDYVLNHWTYSFYLNTHFGAIGMLTSRVGNCCDKSHILIALARAACIPARYGHGQCIFSNGRIGHVWPELFLNGTWLRADPTSHMNSIGHQNNCKDCQSVERLCALGF